MRGLIYGDVMGSVYEWKPVDEQKSITEPRRFTDDTVLGAAVADALLTCHERSIRDDAGILNMVTEKLREYGRRHPDAGYSRSFRKWTESRTPAPYGSKTNGAIMRCSPAGWLARSPEEARRLGGLTAMPTHDHPEAVQAAELTAEIVYRLRMGESVEQMYVILHENGYRIPQLKDIRPITEFDFTCKTTLPIAFAAFYEAVQTWDLLNHKGYSIVDHAVKNAISLGGDTDTNAAIAAAFAEAWNFAWGFRKEDGIYEGNCLWYDNEFRWEYHWAETEKYLTSDIIDVIRRMDEIVPEICPVRVCGEFAYRTDDRGEAVILKYPCSEDGAKDYERNIDSFLAVPEKLDGFPVTAVGPRAFNPSRLGFRAGYIIPEGVRSIGDYAFGRVRKVVLPKSVGVIGVRAFSRYNSVGNDLPENLKVLGSYAFEEVKELPRLPEGLEYIGKGAITKYKGFDGKWADGKCIIPKSVKRMDPYALGLAGLDLCWVYRNSCGEEFCRVYGHKYNYADPEDAAGEAERCRQDLKQKEEERQEAAERYRKQIQAEQEEYELVEVSVSRYAGWREHAEQAGYIIDGLDRVFERRRK